MQVDERRVAHDFRFVRLDEPDSAHIGRQVVDLVDALGGLEGVLPAPEVQLKELMRMCCLVFRLLEIDAAHPVAAFHERAAQMMADEATRTRDEDSFGRSI